VTAIFLGVATFLFANLLAGMQRILRGPTRADRMLAAQLFGTTGVAILLMLGAATEGEGGTDVALVFAILAVINVVVFVRHASGDGPE
jgi:multicomponent Na+:H+ antiporter subunit F